jgi:fatty acid desaturase
MLLGMAATDHATLRASLPAEARAALTERDDRAGLGRLAVHGGALLALGAAIAAQVPFWEALMLPQGILLAFLFTLQHETTHGTPFASGRLNEWIGRATGVVIVQPFLWFRHFHFAHHRHTGDPERDPELAGGAEPDDWPGFLWHLSTLGYWRDKAAVLARTAFGRIEAPYLPARLHPRLRREARTMLALYAAAAAFTLAVSPVLLRVWLVPLVLGFPVLRLYLLAEHGRCPRVADMLDNTRTTSTAAFVRFLAWNMPYHAEHHLYPQVPFHRLPDLHARIAPHLRQTSPGYAAFTRDYVAGFGDSRRSTGRRREGGS